METTHHDEVAFSKELEAKINKRIHELTNSRGFTLAWGRAMDAHLARLKIHKKLTTRWLKRLDIPNKDEVAELSIRLVDCVEKIDLLDDTIYSFKKRQQINLTHLKMVRQSWEELLVVLRTEEKELKAGNLTSLEKELIELKRLFQIEFEMEE
ncbi:MULTISPECIES: hypothetical protein [Neobacillus]|uniref:Uncharacterized protein n=1 Tax=Neobacillus rhizophilus TaxID=2833579 RepID=A0A942U455_9BACI|nr:MULTISPECIES: hypothetical protein [Neobacillus]MBS4212096.1 hypothetical protein [Neobacillus rhizophilus]MBU8915527.1 hypothetical protein [Bacillus sp. FJAT-29953]